ncbi:GAF and ANTAR domain-containing protein [Nocardia sp. NPDC004068]|uniref:GAF and ANTAR domain-containing protein n=1 Tax=Nocardia sp. NPDC004068 TaxID=3364303 RepID=UPI00367B819B
MNGRTHTRLHAAIAAIGQPVPAATWGHRICAACVTCLPGVDAVAVTLRADIDSLEIFGSSCDWGQNLEDAQYGFGEGPARDAYALRAGEPVKSVQIERDPRWPIFGAYAATVNAGAVTALPLRLGAAPFGSLDLYSAGAQAISDRTRDDATTLTALTGRALAEENDQAPWRIRSEVVYHDVDTACGMLAAHSDYTLADALARLRAHAFATDQTLSCTAADVIAGCVNLLPDAAD